MALVTYTECDGGCGRINRGDTYLPSWYIFSESDDLDNAKHFCSPECAGDSLNSIYSARDALLDRLNITLQEVGIIEQIASGKSNKEIATKFKLATSTIKNRLSLIYLKLGVLGRTQTILMSEALYIINIHELSVQFMNDNYAKKKMLNMLRKSRQHQDHLEGFSGL